MGFSMPRRAASSQIATAVSAVLTATAPLVAVAQEPAPGTVLETIIVTATRREASVQEIPFNIAAFGPESLERQRLTDLSEFTRVVPGFYLADQGPRVTPQAWNFCCNGFPARGHARFLSYRPAPVGLMPADDTHLQFIPARQSK